MSKGYAISAHTEVNPAPSWASIDDISTQLRKSSEQARAQLAQDRRKDDLILLLQTLHPQIWKDLSDLLNARDAMLGEDI